MERSCRTPENPIVAENCLPGTEDWHIQNYDPRIAGFASTTSVNLGETVDFFIHSGAEDYDLVLYRSGYYGGAGARRLLAVRNLPAQSQPKCHVNRTTGLVSCSNWSVTYSLKVPDSWTSGIYFAKIRGSETGGENYLQFVVRDDDHDADILFQQSVSTYQAYNDYGGKSLYFHNSSSPPTISATGRAVKVSFDRPYQTPQVYYGNTYFFSDYPMVRWLEAQGYDVTYSTNLDTHRSGAGDGPNRLLDHRVFLSVGHDEYWSAAMRSAITQARDAGVHLGFFSSNVGYWRVRFEPDPWSGEPDRVMVSFKTTESGPPDPSGHPTTTWRDPSGANEPENALTGVQYLGDNDEVYFPLRVTAAMGADRIYRHTPLQSMPPDTYADIGKGLVGWEWDTVVENGLTPEDLVVLAETPVFGEIVVDAGRRSTVGKGLAHTTRYIAPSGAIVFSASTNIWGWGLEWVDPNPILQQVTCNLLADMGAHPATPAPTLVLDGRAGSHGDAPDADLVFHPIDSPAAPEIADITWTTTPDSITVRWKTVTETRGQLWVASEAGEINDRNAKVADVADHDAARSHEVTALYLTPSSPYYFQVVAFDESGSAAISPLMRTRTQPGPLALHLRLSVRSIYLGTIYAFVAHPVLSVSASLLIALAFSVGLGALLRARLGIKPGMGVFPGALRRRTLANSLPKEH